jgi:DNA-binding transcriptional ArsR family regulator
MGSRRSFMVSTASLAEVAALVGDPARAAMLLSLLDGRALTASELARAGGVTPQTASGHLGRLSEAGLLAVAKQGRHRYHRLASAHVARMLEGIMLVASFSGRAPEKPLAVGPRDKALRAARTCYDHIAGRLGVAIADAMAARGHLELAEDGGMVSPAGLDFLRGLGIDLAADLTVKGASLRSRRPFCRPCLDWSERRPHIAGKVGAAICAHAFAAGWIRRRDGTRALEVTPAGRLAFRERFGIEDEVTPIIGSDTVRSAQKGH